MNLTILDFISESRLKDFHLALILSVRILTNWDKSWKPYSLLPTKNPHPFLPPEQHVLFCSFQTLLSVTYNTHSLLSGFSASELHTSSISCSRSQDYHSWRADLILPFVVSKPFNSSINKPCNRQAMEYYSSFPRAFAGPLAGRRWFLPCLYPDI